MVGTEHKNRRGSLPAAGGALFVVAVSVGNALVDSGATGERRRPFDANGCETTTVVVKPADYVSKRMRRTSERFRAQRGAAASWQ